VATFGRRLSAALLTLALAAGQAGVCAGWMPTAEARMACCLNDGACPMHKSGPEAESTRVLTQAEADRCCAAAEQDDSAPLPSIAGFFTMLAAALSPVPVLLPTLEPHPELWRAAVPLSTAHVPKHVLLSVFLV
jgi:hypothetical protein